MATITEKKKLHEIKNLYTELLRVSKKEGLSFELNYHLAKLMLKLKEIMTAYETTMQKYLKEHNITTFYDNKTKTYKANSDDLDALNNFKEEHEKLLNEEHELTINKLPINLLKNTDVEASFIQEAFWLLEGEI